ncbi:GLUT4 regulating protein TUG-domain-containing protein [Podospora didyma]|uniref:GLUT4 regulating protein TUG-domain-containing protein n=1 Tax=Podospora didyma TaxID=330526 RepID=A0AAE0P6D9_9PEZI|nr:GLUT4 regulating protein TUG-domain-containing protein [Podospora didyma]
MSAHVEVVAADLRRTKVKVTPGTHLVDVLNEACQKLKVKSDNYLLKHKQKIVDLSGPFRTSGLPPGAKLELVLKSNSPSVVSIALDVAGRRLTKKLPSDMSLWQVLRQFESTETGLSITGRGLPKSSGGEEVSSGAGQLYYEAPVINILGKEYSALEDLQKSLSQCGINSGSIVLRLAFRGTDKTLYEAMGEISKYMNEVDPNKTEGQPAENSVSAPGSEEVKGGEVPAEGPTATETTSPLGSQDVGTGVFSTTPAETSKEDDLMTFDDEAEVPATSVAGLHLDGVFAAPTSSTPVAAQIQEDDSVYEPTIAHAQLHQQRLNARGQNKRLKSDAELAAAAAEEAAKLAKITTVHLKIRFPDQTSAQWTIGRDGTGSKLYDTVRGVMAHPSQPFKLLMSGTKTAILDNDKLLIETYKLKSAELLNLLWEDEASSQARNSAFLKGSVASKAKEVVVREVPATAAEDDTAAGPSKLMEKAAKAFDPDALAKKMPKWMKLGKK